jgi:PIN domain nuclease of toxin-antitoxin system
MKLLLDTHVLLALPDRNTTRLGRRVERLLNDEEHDLHASVASLWEMAIKHRLGKLRISPNLDSWPELLAGLRIDVIQITASHALGRSSPSPTREILSTACFSLNVRSKA